jgi:hypothetical protein
LCFFTALYSKQCLLKFWKCDTSGVIDLARQLEEPDTYRSILCAQLLMPERFVQFVISGNRVWMDLMEMEMMRWTEKSREIFCSREFSGSEKFIMRIRKLQEQAARLDASSFSSDPDLDVDNCYQHWDLIAIAIERWNRCSTGI